MDESINVVLGGGLGDPLGTVNVHVGVREVPGPPSAELSRIVLVQRTW
jgi:hypothetical protein